MTASTLYSTLAPDQKSMVLARRLPASQEQVWAAWTRIDLLELWFGPAVRGEPGAGNRFVLEGRGQHGDTITCEVLSWEPPRHMELAWTYTGEPETRVTLDLAATEDGHTELTLRHDGMVPPVVPVEYAAGWHMYTDSLEAHLTGAPPLVESDARFSELMPDYLRTLQE